MAGRSGGQQPPGWPRQHHDPIYRDLSALGEGAGFEANKTKLNGMSLLTTDLPGDRSQGAALYEALILSQLKNIPEPCREAVRVGLNLLDGYLASGSGPRLVQLGVKRGLEIQGSDCKSARNRWDYGRGWLADFIREEINRRNITVGWTDLLRESGYYEARQVTIQPADGQRVAEDPSRPATQSARLDDAPLSTTSSQDPPFSAELKVAIESARKHCKARNRMVYTPDLLLALLEMPNRRVAECFDQVDPGMAQRTREHLYGNLARTPVEDFKEFRPFSWLKFLEVRRAWKLALEEGPDTEVNEIHLLLGILHEHSVTNERLVEFLGARHGRLSEEAETRRDNPPRPITP